MTNAQGSDAAIPPSSLSRRGTGKVIPSSAGTTVRALREALREIVGQEVFAAAMRTLQPAEREEFEPVTPMMWVPVDLIHTVVARIAKEAGRPFDVLMDEAVQRAAEKTLRTAWRVLLRVTRDSALLSRTPILYAKWRNIGRLEAKSIARGRVELHLTEWPSMGDRNIRSLGVTIETVLRLAGRKQIRLQSQSTVDGAKYTVVWNT